jgi:hypothetical protein
MARFQTVMPRGSQPYVKPFVSAGRKGGYLTLQLHVGGVMPAPGLSGSLGERIGTSDEIDIDVFDVAGALVELAAGLREAADLVTAKAVKLSETGTSQ